MRAEFLIPGRLSFSTAAASFIDALMQAAKAAGDQTRLTQTYFGQDELLVLYGVGEAMRNAARNAHVRAGHHVLLWDLGYFGPNMNRNAYLRCSIDHDHPQGYLDRTPSDPSRWDALGIELREDYVPGGHILLIGLGRKSRKYLNEPEWERNALARIRAKYPGQPIVYRPKPNHPSPHLDVTSDDTSTIQDLLKGAALVVCRHSNVAVDAAIAGVPFECEDGAAMWLAQRTFTRANRLEFLRRLAHWQYKVSEASTAWAFARTMLIHEKVAA